MPSPALVGPEFLVNTTASADRAAITALSDGSFVVVWTDFSNNGTVTGTDIRGQMFHSDGSPFGTEFLVNTTTDRRQEKPTITALSDDRFVVTWEDYSSDTTGPDIRAQIFSSTGTGLGSEILINTTIAGMQEVPTVAALEDGRFVVAWTDRNGSVDVYGQMYAGNGQPAGFEFQINTVTENFQYAPRIVGLSDGRFVTVWHDFSGTDGDTSDLALRGQIFTSLGTPSGPEFRINSTTLGSQSQPAITALPDGRFVVTWMDESGTGGDTSGPGIRGQVFTSTGGLSGTEFLVNTTTTNRQFEPVITALPDGRFVIAWTDDSNSGGDTFGYAIRAQVFDANGVASGEEFLVNTTTEEGQTQPTITALTGNRFVVGWTDQGGTIRGQIFDVGPVTVTGTPGDDTTILGGNPGDDLILGLEGNDLLGGSTGEDTLEGGIGDDTYTVNSAGDVVRGEIASGLGGGTDTLITSVDFTAPDNVEIIRAAPGLAPLSLTGNDAAGTLEGNDGANLLDGRGGNDTLTGGLGRDSIFGGEGDDTIIVDRRFYDDISGGEGGETAGDTVDFSASGGNFVIDLAGGGYTVGGITYSLAGIEKVITGNGRDIITGSDNAETIISGGKRDQITGGLGNDTIDAGGGNDVVFAALGNDSTNGGADVDTLDFSALTVGVNLAMATGVSSNIGTHLGYESVICGSGNDTITGADTNDTVRGGAGNDSISGGRGADDLYGLAGVDTLNGGAGNDTLTGGAFADVFQFIRVASAGADLVTDWNNGADRLALDNELWVGALTAAQVVSTFASVVNGDVVFDFGSRGSFTLDNVTSTAGLDARIDII